MNILYHCTPPSVFKTWEDLKLKCKLEWPNDSQTKESKTKDSATCGRMVTLLSRHNQPVGVGTIVEGETQSLHGKCVPASYTKLVIDYIQTSTEPLF